VSAGTNVVGYFTITVTAQSGGLVHSVKFQVYVAAKPDFTLSAGPASQTIRAGSSANVALTLSSLGGFTGPVQVYPTILATGVAFTPRAPIITLSSGGVANMTITVSTSVTTAPGSYAIMFIGNATTGAHLIGVVLNILPPPDFSLTAATSGLIITSGASAATLVAILPINGFTGPVTLSTKGPIGFTAGFSPNPILGGTGSSTLTLSVASTVAAGNYTVTVVASGGGFNHTVSFPVTVSPTSVSYTHLTLPTICSV